MLWVNIKHIEIAQNHQIKNSSANKTCIVLKFEISLGDEWQWTRAEDAMDDPCVILEIVTQQ